MPGGGRSAPDRARRPVRRRDYDYDVTAEEVPVNGDHGERELPRTDDK